MQFLLGLLTAVVFFLCVAAAFYLGYRHKPKAPAPIPIDEEEQQRNKKMDKHFKALFSYDVETAYGRRTE